MLLCDVPLFYSLLLNGYRHLPNLISSWDLRVWNFDLLVSLSDICTVLSLRGLMVLAVLMLWFISYDKSYSMCDVSCVKALLKCVVHSVSRVDWFLHYSTCLLFGGVSFRVESFGHLYSKPSSDTLFQAFHEVQCLKMSQYFLQFAWNTVT